MRTAFSFSLVLCAALPQVLSAQGQDNPALCWEPRPAPACRRALITEVGVASSLERTPVAYVTSELGVMKTTRSGNALGLTLFTAMLDDDGRFGLKARYRHWFNAKTVVEAGAGPLLVNSSFRAGNVGFVGHATFGYRDWVALTTQIELASYEQTGMRARAFLGARVGSYPGFGGNLLGAVLGLIILSVADPFDNVPN
jgi:hypothetical protein